MEVVPTGQGDETGVLTDSKVHSVAIFANHHKVLMLTVDVLGDSLRTEHM